MIDYPTNVRHHLILARDLDRFGADDRELRRMRDRGELERVRRGCYMRTEEWRTLDGVGRHCARIHAVAANAQIEPVFSHFSAAALHGIPLIGNLPVDVHVTIERGSRRRGQPELKSHALELLPHEIVRIDGVLATSVERTIQDIALTMSFESAVAACDWALAEGYSRVGLHQELERRNPPTRFRAATRAIEFGDERSGSPGESMSRARMYLMGFPIPDLQVPFDDAKGRAGIVDFYWEHADLIGEFDGRGKYLREDLRDGRSAAEVVLVEKVREDRLRSLGPRMVRWGWAVAQDMNAFGRLLSGAGLTSAR